MGEPFISQPSQKRRLVRTGIALFLGGIASVLLFFISLAFIGVGHGPGTMLVISGGAGGLSFFVFPLACAGVASKWPPAMWGGLMWECFHHALSLFGPDSIFRLSDTADRLRGQFSSGVFVVWLCLYVVAHLSVPTAFWFSWRKGNVRLD